MENPAKTIESLLEDVAGYGKTSFELAKLQALDKASDIVSTIIPHAFVFLLLAVFMLFLNLGLAFWLGVILGNTFFGFFAVAGFYFIVGLMLHFFMHKWIKKVICNFIIRSVYK